MAKRATSSWTIDDLEKLKAQGKIQGFTVVGKQKPDTNIQPALPEAPVIIEVEKETPKDKRRSKYGNEKVEWEGEIYDSKKELARWLELEQLQKDGIITELFRQVTFELDINGKVICRYRADAVYTYQGEMIVEDVKSEITRKHPVYRIKKKMMKAIHGIDILEI